MKKFVVVLDWFGLFGWEKHFKFADTKEVADMIGNSYRKGFDPNKVHVIEVIPYSEYLTKYKKNNDIEKVVTINVFDFNSGEHLHCFSGSSKLVCNGELLTFDYTIKNLGIEIKDAEFYIEWCSKKHNGEQTALVTLIPNSGKVTFTKTLKQEIDASIKTLIEVERRVELMGNKDELKDLISAHNILSKYLND